MAMSLFIDDVGLLSTVRCSLKNVRIQTFALRSSLLALCLSTSSNAIGQGRVTGVVTDPAGLVVAHASVEALARGKGAGIAGTLQPWI